MKVQIQLFLILIILLSYKVETKQEVLQCEIVEFQTLKDCLKNLEPETTSLIIESKYVESTKDLSTYLPENPQLQYIQFSFNVVDDYSGFSDCFRNSYKLSTLDIFLGSFSFSGQEQQDMATMFQGKNSLENLKINWGDYDMTDISAMVEIFEPIQNQLKKFEFRSDAHLKSFSPLKQILNNQKNLEEFTYVFSIFDTSPQSLQTLHGLCYELENLKKAELYINYLPVTFTFNIFENTFPNGLESLELNTQWGQIKYLEGFSSMTYNLSNLTSLSLGLYGNQINDDQIQYLQEGFENIKQIQSLNLNINNNNIKDISCLENQFVSLVNLQSLSISFSGQNKKLTDIDGIQNVFKNQSSLNTLTINASSNLITNLNPAIESLRNLQNLKTLNLNFNDDCMDGSNDQIYREKIMDIVPNLGKLSLETTTRPMYSINYCQDNEFIQ